MRDEFKEKIIEKFLSGRFISTVALIITYCLVMLIGAACCVILAINDKFDLAEKLFIYIVGTLTGSAVGAVVAYHFKKQNGGSK